MRARGRAEPLGPAAPGIQLSWGRVGSASPGTALGKGPREWLRILAREVMGAGEGGVKGGRGLWEAWREELGVGGAEAAARGRG